MGGVLSFYVGSFCYTKEKTNTPSHGYKFKIRQTITTKFSRLTLDPGVAVMPRGTYPTASHKGDLDKPEGQSLTEQILQWEK